MAEAGDALASLREKAMASVSVGAMPLPCAVTERGDGAITLLPDH
jgi:hypothetical protein